MTNMIISPILSRIVYQKNRNCSTATEYSWYAIIKQTKTVLATTA